MTPTLANLFDLSSTPYTSLFEGLQYPWEVLPRIEQYCAIGAWQMPGFRLATSEEYSGTTIGAHVFVGENVVIESGAVILGPAIIGSGTTIRSGAYIRENVVLGQGCLIGKATELKNAVLLQGVMAAHHNYIGDSIIGNRVHFGAGVVCANLKSSQENVVIRNGEEHYDTGLQKVGAFIGDGVELGANTVTNPGTVIGCGSIIYPLANIRGIIAEDVIVKVRQQIEITEKKNG